MTAITNPNGESSIHEIRTALRACLESCNCGDRERLAATMEANFLYDEEQYRHAQVLPRPRSKRPVVLFGRIDAP